MESRRVQVTGGSSYVVTLPKNWIDQQEIKKNDPVYMIVRKDGTLLVSSKSKEEFNQSAIEIDCSAISEEDLLAALIDAYVSGYTTIRLASSDRLPYFVRGTTQKFIRGVIGQGIIEDTNNLIILKDLLNPSEIPFDANIRRLSEMLLRLRDDTQLLIEGDNHGLGNDMISRYEEVDRLNLLLLRQATLLQNR